MHRPPRRAGGDLPPAFQEFLDRFAPVDGFEIGLIEEMAASHWRMRRAWTIEKTSLAEAIDSQPPGDQATRLTAAFSQVASSPDLPLLHRYETRLHLMFQRAFHNLLLLRTLDEPDQPGPAVPNEPSPISGHSAPTPPALPNQAPNQAPPEPPPSRDRENV